MARWLNVRGASAPTGMKGSIDYGANIHDTTWQIEQDEKPFLDLAKYDRENLGRNSIDGMKKFATIPDIVAIEINEKYHIDIHAPDTMNDRDKMAKFKYIIQTEYPDLLSF